MSNNDERDYAEERANANLLRQERETELIAEQEVSIGEFMYASDRAREFNER